MVQPQLYLEEEQGPTLSLPGRWAGFNPIYTWKRSRVQPYLYQVEEQIPTISIPGRGAGSNPSYIWKRSRVQTYLYLEDDQGPTLSIPGSGAGSSPGDSLDSSISTGSPGLSGFSSILEAGSESFVPELGVPETFYTI